MNLQTHNVNATSIQNGVNKQNNSFPSTRIAQTN